MVEPYLSYLAHPADSVGGVISVPGDKSISHRALMLGAVAEGITQIEGILEGEDCIATWVALEKMGVSINLGSNDAIVIKGVGLQGLRAPPAPLDLGNSGTAMRLLTGLLAPQSFEATLTGDQSLRGRPMKRVVEPLRAMGAKIETQDGYPPVLIQCAENLMGVSHRLKVASAQVKSALLFAGLSAKGVTTIQSPGITRDHTERMLLGMGVKVVTDDSHKVSLEGPAQPRGTRIVVPGDFSSAAFFIVVGCLASESGLLIKNVGVNPSRTGLLTILRAMGAQIEIRHNRDYSLEPIADIEVKKSTLHGIEVPQELVSQAIDEFPALFVAAACADGTTVVSGAKELRYKESDRLRVMAEGLKILGAEVSERPDGLTISGSGLSGGTVDSCNDHRVAMAFALASAVAREPIEILGANEVATSFPNFLATAAQAGLKVESSAGATVD